MTAALRAFVGFALLLTCSGCASYLSQTKAPGTFAKGLTYYMPMRAIIIQVIVTTDTKTKKQIETSSLVPGVAAVPDISQAFTLSDQQNWLGDNHVTLAVSTTGLLQTANSATTSGVDTILKNAATAAAEISMLAHPTIAQSTPPPAGAPAPLVDNCSPGNTYNVIIWPPNSTLIPICGFTVTVSRLFGGKSLPTNFGNDAAPSDSDSGIFYKTDLPYLVTVSPIPGGSGASNSFIALSPNEAPTSFLPINRTLFANNTVKLALTEGEVTGFEQDNTGELVALSQIPADVLDAYFSAISKIVPEQITANNDRSALVVSETQRKMCMSAILANPLGKTPADQATAYANIKASCGSTPVPSAAGGP